MQAIIHWSDNEHPTTCTAQVRLPAPKRHGTVYKLYFDRKWWRILQDKTGVFIQFGANGTRHRVEIVES